MKIQLLQGRDTIDEEMQDHGYAGPCLERVTAVHDTFGATTNVYFADASAAEAARVLTGWDRWDDNALEMTRVEDCIQVRPLMGAVVSVPSFYGDWEVQEDDFAGLGTAPRNMAEDVAMRADWARLKAGKPLGDIVAQAYRAATGR